MDKHSWRGRSFVLAGVWPTFPPLGWTLHLRFHHCPEEGGWLGGTGYFYCTRQEVTTPGGKFLLTFSTILWGKLCLGDFFFFFVLFLVRGTVLYHRAVSPSHTALTLSDKADAHYWPCRHCNFPFTGSEHLQGLGGASWSRRGEIKSHVLRQRLLTKHTHVDRVTLGLLGGHWALRSHSCLKGLTICQGKQWRDTKVKMHII